MEKRVSDKISLPEKKSNKRLIQSEKSEKKKKIISKTKSQAFSQSRKPFEKLKQTKFSKDKKVARVKIDKKKPENVKKELRTKNIHISGKSKPGIFKPRQLQKKSHIGARNRIAKRNTKWKYIRELDTRLWRRLAIIFVKRRKRNLFYTVITPKGRCVFTLSAGKLCKKLNVKGRGKSIRHSVYVNKLIMKTIKLFLKTRKIRDLHVYFSPATTRVVDRLVTYFERAAAARPRYPHLYTIVPNRPHNGCRPPKPRRKKRRSRAKIYNGKLNVKKMR